MFSIILFIPRGISIKIDISRGVYMRKKFIISFILLLKLIRCEGVEPIDNQKIKKTK
jgi:hypothetical protein